MAHTFTSPSFVNKALCYVCLLLLPTLILSSCSVSKYLKEKQYLLTKQTFKGNKTFSNSDLDDLLRQKPNRRLLGTPFYVYAYFIGSKSFDSTASAEHYKEVKTRYNQKLIQLGDSAALHYDDSYLDDITKYDSIIDKNPNRKSIIKLRKKRDRKLAKLTKSLRGNWVMRVIGEPPSIYDSSKTKDNNIYIKSYYQKRGFLNVRVSSHVDTIKRKIKEQYTIEESTRYTIRNIKYSPEDSTLTPVISINNKESLLKKGDHYTEEHISLEREHLLKIMKGQGYFDFSASYIYFEIDTSVGNNQLDIEVLIVNPEQTNYHPKYTIDKVIFNTDIGSSSQKQDTALYNNISIIYSKNNFSKKILYKKLEFLPGDYYDQSKIQLTQRQLASLDMYKFVNINFEKIPGKDSSSRKLIAYIRTTPLKKFQSTEELGLSVAANFIPGPAAVLNFKSRNTFRGFEVFEANFRATVVGQASLSDNSQFYKSEEYATQTSLSFPQLFFPLPKFSKSILENYSPITKFSASYVFTRRPEYARKNFNINMTYNFTLSSKKYISFSLIDLNLVNTTEKSNDFNLYLQNLKLNGNNLINSFGTSLVSNINFSYTFNNNAIDQNKRSKYFRFYAESGGTLLNLLNKTQLLAATDTILGLKTYRYYKFNTDFRYYVPVRKNTLAMRCNVGIAKAYDNEEILPYERHFFLGGSNSIRAWAPRRLGPGSWVARDPVTGEAIYKYEQPGALMLESSIEYRFKVIRFVDAATFIDAGNSWIWAPRTGVEKSRPEGVFDITQFYKQIAIGTGFGIRLNFSFLILRFDFGFKVKDPAQPEGNRYVFLKSGYKTPTVNLSIGYPF